MTDTNPGGWPDAARPGYPLNPELDRWHWMLAAEGETPVAVLWQKQMWHLGYIGMPAWVFANAVYLGPCHTPAEVAAQVEAARRDEREANALYCAQRQRAYEVRAADADMTARHYTAADIAGTFAAAFESAAAAIRARGDA